MRSFGITCAMTAQVAVFWSICSPFAHAIPSPAAHVHNPMTVHWEQDGTPDGSVDHNHLTGDTIVKAGQWAINKAWDNTVLSSVLLGDADWVHGMIVNPMGVRYGWDAAQMPPVAARDAVETVYDAWQADATTQYLAKKDPWDLFAIDFNRDDGPGAVDITISFVDDLVPYGTFSSANKTIRFKANPSFLLKTPGGMKQIRLGDAGPSGTEITVPVDWSYDGTPNSTATDIDYSVDAGATWTDAPPVGFGDLDWAGASYGHPIAPADEINIFEMDFLTIARHEVGHSIALGHIGTAIMRFDIANSALFGGTMQIDTPSATAVAIDYTYALELAVGDGNGDGWVDGLDYLIWASNFGANPGPDGDPSDGDFDDNGVVDGIDYLLWAASFGTHIGATTVPEPGTLSLACLALLGMIVSRRQRR